MSKRALTLLIRLTFLYLLGLTSQAFAVTERPLNVYVAASMTDLATELAGAFTDKSGISVRVVPEATSTLARQIAAGAPADILLSANQDWVEWLINRNPDLTGKARIFAGNGLVLVTGDETNRGDLDTVLGPGKSWRIAIADPDHVPAGLYARQSLNDAGYWKNLSGRLVPAANVRDALRFAETGQTPFAIVYESDAAASSVTIVAPLPEPEPPVGYVALPVLNGANVDDFMGFLVSATAETLLCKHGFRLPEGRAC